MTQENPQTRPLSARQQKFVEEYLIDLNAKRASIRAGYAQSVNTDKILKLPQVKHAIEQAIAARQERTQLSADEVIYDLRELRDVCMARKAVTVSVRTRAADGTESYQDETITKFDASAAAKALELLGKHLNIFTEKVELDVGLRDDVLDLLANQEELSRQQSKKLAEKIAARNGG